MIQISSRCHRATFGVNIMTLLEQYDSLMSFPDPIHMCASKLLCLYNVRFQKFGTSILGT